MTVFIGVGRNGWCCVYGEVARYLNWKKKFNSSGSLCERMQMYDNDAVRMQSQGNWSPGTYTEVCQAWAPFHTVPLKIIYMWPRQQIPTEELSAPHTKFLQHLVQVLPHTSKSGMGRIDEVFCKDIARYSIPYGDVSNWQPSKDIHVIIEFIKYPWFSNKMKSNQSKLLNQMSINENFCLYWQPPEEKG